MKKAELNRETGRLVCPYPRLASLLGSALCEPSGDGKITAIWQSGRHGAMQEIYDYKSNVPFQQNTRWGYSGFSIQQIEALILALNSPANTEGAQNLLRLGEGRQIGFSEIFSAKWCGPTALLEEHHLEYGPGLQNLSHHKWWIFALHTFYPEHVLNAYDLLRVYAASSRKLLKEWRFESLVPDLTFTPGEEKRRTLAPYRVSDAVPSVGSGAD